jgi:hypothetical protein
MESGKELMEIVILENGKTQRLTGMECTLGKMVTGMRVSGIIASNMARALIFLQIKTFM